MVSRIDSEESLLKEVPVSITKRVIEARAAAWELAAFSFRYPTEELLHAIKSGEWVAAAQEIAQVLGLKLPKKFGDRIIQGQEADNDANGLEVFRVEATRLFVGAPQPVVSPYEGVWRAAQDGVQAFLYVNPHAMAVERFMKACNLTRPEGTNEPLDHVAAECELLEYLTVCLSDSENGSTSLPSCGGVPGGSAQAAYDMFLAEHVRVWVPDFTAAVSTETRLPFYRDAAIFLSILVAY